VKNRGAKKNRLKFVTRYVPVPEEEFTKIAEEPERIDQSAHQVGNISDMNAVAELALEVVAVQESQKELGVLLLPVVGGGGHEQKVTGYLG
jgi:hypothetical protein